MERGELQVIYRVHRPAVTLICVNILVYHFSTCTILREQTLYLLAWGVLLCLFEKRYRVPQRGAGCYANRSVLVSQKLLGLSGPGHQLAVQAHPICIELLPRTCC